MYKIYRQLVAHKHRLLQRIRKYYKLKSYRKGRIIIALSFLVFGYIVAFPQVLALTVCIDTYGLCGLPIVWQLALGLYVIEIVSFFTFAYLMKDITTAWRRFALFFVPITLVSIMTTPVLSSGGWALSNPGRETVTWWYMQIFTFFSTILFIFFTGCKVFQRRFVSRRKIDTKKVFVKKIISAVILFAVVFLFFNILIPDYEGVINVLDIDDGILSVLLSAVASILYLSSIFLIISALKRRPH